MNGLVGKKRKIKLIAAKLSEKITEVGIWAGRDKALAGLIAERIKQEVQDLDDDSHRWE